MRIATYTFDHMHKLTLISIDKLDTNTVSEWSGPLYVVIVAFLIDLSATASEERQRLAWDS